MIKTLRIAWLPVDDELRFTIDMSKLSNKPQITKRQLLSDASKLYNPCGLLSSIIIKTKLFMEEIWKSGVDWDTHITDSILRDWQQYKEELPCIESIKISR